MPLCKALGPLHAARTPRIGMKNPRFLRLAFSIGLLASPVFALSSAEFDSLRTKADRGNAIAQYNLGLAYADRREPAYDPAQAYAWLSLAAANGTTGKALASVTSLLTPDQLAEGKRRLTALTASPVSPISTSASPILAVDEPSAPAPSPTPAAEPAQDQKKLSAELAAAWKENELLKSGLTAQLADANKRVAIAEAALASKDREIASLQTRLTEASTPSAAPIGVSAELASLRAERDQLQATATAATAELAELRASSSKASAEQAALRGKLAHALTEVADARRAQNIAETETSSLKAAADRASAERLAVAAQLETVTTELATAKEASAAPKTPAPNPLADTVKALEQDRDTLATRLADAMQRITHGEVSLVEKEKEIAALQTRVAETTTSKPAETLSETGLAVLKADRDRLAESVKSLEQERDSLTAQLATAKIAVPAATPDVVAAPVPSAPTPDTSSANEAATKLADLEKAKAETDTKLAAALRSFTLQQAEIDRLQKALASIDAERAATVTKLDTATSELNALRPQAASAVTASAEAGTLRAQLATANQSLAEKSSALATANLNLADARKTVDTATSELVATRDQLRQTQDQSAASAVEAQQLKTRLALVGNLSATSAPSRPGTIPAISIDLPSTTVAPVATPPAPKVEAPAGPRSHTVGPGDSLSRISKQYYGTAARWNDILQANKDVIRNPDALALGTKLRIP